MPEPLALWEKAWVRVRRRNGMHPKRTKMAGVACNVCPGFSLGQLVIDQWQELLGRLRIAFLNLRQNAGDRSRNPTSSHSLKTAKPTATTLSIRRPNVEHRRLSRPTGLESQKTFE